MNRLRETTHLEPIEADVHPQLMRKVANGTKCDASNTYLESGQKVLHEVTSEGQIDTHPALLRLQSNQ
jgi:hypothetical protein